VVDFLHPPGSGDEVVLVPYDDGWPDLYAGQESRIRQALGDTALEVHHAGSTSVPGLTAKPVIDIVLVVPDPVEEASYVPRLETAGYTFRVREPEWFQHRFFRGESPRVNLHVFGAGCSEVTRMLAFRDHLRRDDADRTLYQDTKLRLAERSWRLVQDYADAKTDVVLDIMSRAQPR
jgi:GrpB-like predicted nucleotidyltransferase (UPF0157 family)